MNFLGRVVLQRVQGNASEGTRNIMWSFSAPSPMADYASVSDLQTSSTWPVCRGFALAFPPGIRSLSTLGSKDIILHVCPAKLTISTVVPCCEDCTRFLTPRALWRPPMATPGAISALTSTASSLAWGRCYSVSTKDAWLAY